MGSQEEQMDQSKDIHEPECTLPPTYLYCGRCGTPCGIVEFPAHESAPRLSRLGGAKFVFLSAKDGGPRNALHQECLTAYARESQRVSPEIRYRFCNCTACYEDRVTCRHEIAIYQEGIAPVGTEAYGEGVIE